MEMKANPAKWVEFLAQVFSLDLVNCIFLQVKDVAFSMSLFLSIGKQSGEEQMQLCQKISYM